MNHEQYIQSMAAIGHPREVAEKLIRLCKDSSDLALRINNFVPKDDGLYEIWISGDRDDFFRVSGANGEEFLGTLSDAYEYVFEQARKWHEKQTPAQHGSE